MMENIRKIEIKKIRRMANFGPKIVSINGVSEFRGHHSVENAWHYIGRAPTSRCVVIIQDDWVEIHNVCVNDSEDRGQGHGTAMIADIRQAFPDHHIWVNTGECSRGFWENMIERGYIDSIENEYWWPCWDTTCITCHPTRTTGKRRAGAW